MDLSGVIALEADEARAKQSRQTHPENRQRQTRRHLIDRQCDGEEAEQGGHQGSREDARQRPQSCGARRIGPGETHRRAHDHHALDAEVENARALRHEFADGGEDEGRRRRHHRHQDQLEHA